MGVLVMASGARKSKGIALGSKETGPTRLRNRTTVTRAFLELRDHVRNLDDNFLLYLHEMVIAELMEPFSAKERQVILESLEGSQRKAK